MPNHTWCVLALSVFLSACPGASAWQDATGPLLTRESLVKDQTRNDVKRLVERRTAVMPAVRTAEEWGSFAERLRKEVLDGIIFRGEAAAWRDAPARVEWLDTIDGGPGYRIRKLRYEALPGLWIPALLYEPEKISGDVPVFLNVNGHDSQGKAAAYKQIRCINQAKRGILALNVEWLGMGQLESEDFNHYRSTQLDLCGTSGVAPFYLALQRGLDVLLSHPHADPRRVGVAGLSGGGWQTILLSALDTRVTLANPVAGYSSFLTRLQYPSDLGDAEQLPADLAALADYTHLTALRAPRPTLLTYNAREDCCFDASHALSPLLEAAGPIFRLHGAEGSLRWHVNSDPGTHNFGKENREALYGIIGDAFYPRDEGFDPREIPSDAEVKTAEALRVEMPPRNAGFHTLASALAQTLPRRAKLPGDSTSAAAWQEARRRELAEIIRAKEYDVQADVMSEDTRDGVKAVHFRLRLGDEWTVPAVELTRGEPRESAILVADDGRAAASEAARRLLSEDRRVIAVDPFAFGESRIRSSAAQFALLVSAAGERPLGVQASQIAAIARWSSRRLGAGAVDLVAVGDRASLAALVAAGIEPRRIAGVELEGALGSLKQVIEEDRSFPQSPELFCFGLLSAFDVKHLVALVAPRPALFRAPSARARRELGALGAWYRLFGADFTPTP